MLHEQTQMVKAAFSSAFVQLRHEHNHIGAVLLRIVAQRMAQRIGQHRREVQRVVEFVLQQHVLHLLGVVGECDGVRKRRWLGEAFQTIWLRRAEQMRALRAAVKFVGVR